MASNALVRRLACSSQQLMKRAAMGASKMQGGHETSTCSKATLPKMMFSAKADPTAPMHKLLLQVHGQLLPEAGSAKLYQMSVLADSEEEAVGIVRSFAALVRSNDTEKLQSFCATNNVILTELKESIGVAAAALMKQATEHNTDVDAEFKAIKAAIISGNEDTLAVKDAVKRIEEEVTKFTFYKFLGYASVVSLLQIFFTWEVGKHLKEKVKAVVVKKTPASDDLA